MSPLERLANTELADGGSSIPAQGNEICAIIVTYYPDGAFPERFGRIAAQVAGVIIVDNGSNPEELNMLQQLTDSGNHHLISNDDNLGIGTALNQGVKLALERGFTWAVTLDQDSIALPDMVAELVGTLQRFPARDSVALVGPNVQHMNAPLKAPCWLRARPGMRWLFECRKCGAEDLSGVTMLITSGALTNLRVCAALGLFWEELFIDYVDIEYCLRARRAGYEVLVSCGAHLEHQLGATREVRILGRGLRPRFHSPTRVFYASRNRVHVIRRHGLAQPHWLLFDVLAMFYNLVRILLVESMRLKKLSAFLLGSWGGLRGKLGPRA